MFKKLTFKITKAHKLKIYILSRAPKHITFYVLGALIRFYQNFFSPNLGKNCRFYPSCSEYTYQAIEKYGLLKGGWKGFKRILKCYPWHPGGVDLP